MVRLAAAASDRRPGWLDRILGWLGVAVWVVGFVFEAGGDWQLNAFRKDPANKGKVMDRGLWRYTRHPNYFGDAAQWWGFALIAFAHWPGILTIASPGAHDVVLGPQDRQAAARVAPRCVQARLRPATSRRPAASSRVRHVHATTPSSVSS